MCQEYALFSTPRYYIWQIKISKKGIILNSKVRRSPHKIKDPDLCYHKRKPLMRRVHTYHDGVETSQNPFVSFWDKRDCIALLSICVHHNQQTISSQLLNHSKCNPYIYKLLLNTFHQNGIGHYFWNLELGTHFAKSTFPSSKSFTILQQLSATYKSVQVMLI